MNENIQKVQSKFPGTEIKIDNKPILVQGPKGFKINFDGKTIWLVVSDGRVCQVNENELTDLSSTIKAFLDIMELENPEFMGVPLNGETENSVG